MTCSATRIEGIGKNDRQPAASRIVEGKARSRRDAFGGGRAGLGDLLGPKDDAREVDARAAEIAEETGARGRTGGILARRAAAMSLRLERAEEHDRVASAARAMVARDEFDRERRDELDDLIAELKGADDPRPVLAELKGSPEGVRFLAESWVEILEGLRAGAGDGPARRRFGPDAPAGDARLIERSEAELARLRRLAVDLDETAGRAIAAARHQAGVLAYFDGSIEGERARRHEASAERSFHRALRAIAEHRTAVADLPARTSVLAPLPAAPRSAPASVLPALGSFPRGRLAAGPADVLDLLERQVAVPGSPEARRNRPDLARVGAGRR